MATPTGYIDETAGGITVSTEGTIYIKFDIRNPNPPYHWHPTSFVSGAAFIKGAAQLTIPITETVEKTMIGGSSFYSQITDQSSGPISARWSEWSPSSPIPNYVRVEQNNSSVASTTPSPQSGLMSFEFISAGGDNCELLGLNIHAELYQPYNSSTLDPVSSGDYEQFGNNTSTWSPFQANEFAHSWTAKQLLAKNYNRVIYDTRQYWSVPI
jgi:hypothetical protein